MDLGFAEALLVLGALLFGAASLSGWLRGTVLSISVLSLGAGIGLSELGLIAVDPASKTILYVVEIALVLTLFSDGLLVERELLRNYWGPTALALVIAMPITLVLLACAAHFLFPALSWQESFLVGAVLSPTDPVVTSAVVTSERVPEKVRHTLNLESGLNDGLALPFVLFFLALATGASSPGGEAARLVGEAVFGAGIGVALAVAAAKLMPRLPGIMDKKYEGIYALSVALLAFAVADLTWGNGLIAVFVCGIALAVVKQEIPDVFTEFNASVSTLFQVITFTTFGALIVATGWDGDTFRLVVFIAFALFVARPAAVMISFARVEETIPNKLFMAWFGPKGVASMLFALLVLASTEANRSLVFDIASFTVVASIVAHGLTDTVGANWLSGQLRRVGGSASADR